MIDLAGKYLCMAGFVANLISYICVQFYRDRLKFDEVITKIDSILFGTQCILVLFFKMNAST